MRGTDERGLGPELSRRPGWTPRPEPGGQSGRAWSPSVIGVAVLGAGRIGKIHARNAAANPRCRLVAVADPVAEAARSLAAEVGCEASTDPKGTAARADVDAIVIGTPTDSHIEFMLSGVRQGKAVLCEKPIGLDIKTVDAAVAEASRPGARVMIAFNRRFDPSAAALKRAITAGDIGDLRQVIITSRDPGPRLYLTSRPPAAF